MLAPKLLDAGFAVTVLDWYLFGNDALQHVAADPALKQVKGDIRDTDLLQHELADCHAVIHLACIANDPCFDLNPALSKAVNFDAFEPLVRISREAGVQRFVYASTSSVYGVSDAPQVTEDHPLLPITDYNKFKGLCEPILRDAETDKFIGTVIRPATVCGYSPRQRLDLTVNILTAHAVEKGVITVFGGEQYRPNVHIEDITDLYVRLLQAPADQVAGRTWNAGWENHTVAEIAQQVAEIVREMVPGREDMRIVTTPSEDIRSYRITSQRIIDELGFHPRRTIRDAVVDLVQAFQAGLLPDALTDDRYYNIRTMRAVEDQLIAAA